MKGLEPTGLGEDLALGSRNSKSPPPLRAEDEWGGVKPGRIRRLGWVTPTR